jgi:hypothetical protein
MLLGYFPVGKKHLTPGISSRFAEHKQWIPKLILMVFNGNLCDVPIELVTFSTILVNALEYVNHVIGQQGQRPWLNEESQGRGISGWSAEHEPGH